MDRRHDRLDFLSRASHSRVERTHDHRLDDQHDLVGVGVMRADLRALVGIEEALE